MILIIFLFLSNYLCICGPETVVLDISKKVNHKSLLFQKFEREEATTHKYVARPEFEISKVVDNNSLVWDGNISNEKCAFAIAHLFNNSALFLHVRVLGKDNENRDLYFEKKEGNWEQVSQWDIPNKCHFDQSSYTLLKEVWFDLKLKPDKNLYDLIKAESNGLRTYIYSPKLGVDVTKVIYGEKTLWEKDGNLSLVKLMVTLLGRTPYLLKLVLRTSKNFDLLYYELKGEEWIPLSLKKYETRLVKVDFELPSFDIKNLDEDKFEKKEYEVFGVRNISYIPKPQVEVLNLVEGETQIWRTTGPGYLEKMWLYKKEEEYITVHLRISSSLGKTETLCYKKSEGEWKLVSSDEL